METDLLSTASTQSADEDDVVSSHIVDELFSDSEYNDINDLRNKLSAIPVTDATTTPIERSTSFGNGRNGFSSYAGRGGFSSGGGDSFNSERSHRGRGGSARGGFRTVPWPLQPGPWSDNLGFNSGNGCGGFFPIPPMMAHAARNIQNSGPNFGGNGFGFSSQAAPFNGLRSSPSRGGALRRPRPDNFSHSNDFGGFSDLGSGAGSGSSRRDGWDADPADSSRPAKPFSQPTPTNDARSSAPMRSLRTASGDVTYPLIYVSPAGTISVVLCDDVVIETAVDRSVRIVCHNNFAAYVNCRGTSSCILHSKARILHSNDIVQCKFISSNDKMAVFGAQGVLFTMSHLTEAYLVNSLSNGPSAVPLDQLEFPPLKNDYTLRLFYSEALTGKQYIDMCKDIVKEATYYRKPDDSLVMHINGMSVRYATNGEVNLDAKPRHISFHPATGALNVRSSYIDMAVQANEKAYVKRGAKRVHVSRSGMVVSDSNCITSMDHFGRIVSCT